MAASHAHSRLHSLGGQVCRPPARALAGHFTRRAANSYDDVPPVWVALLLLLGLWCGNGAAVAPCAADAPVRALAHLALAMRVPAAD